MAAAITDIAGASEVLDRGFVTYSNQAKMEMLGVPAVILEQHGAVSAETARCMAEGALAHTQADLSLAVTGIAGPGGATPGKPVGLVHIAAGRRQHPTITEKHIFPGDRSTIRSASVIAAFDLLYRQMMR